MKTQEKDIEMQKKKNKKQTLQDYLVKNNIFDKFIYNAKNKNKIFKSQSVDAYVPWADTTEGYIFWSKRFYDFPEEDNSMDWLFEEQKNKEDEIYIMFIDTQEIKEAIKHNVVDYHYEYKKNGLNEEDFPVIFKIDKLNGVLHQQNNGKQNIWLRSKYKDWVKKSITWNNYKEKLEQEQKDFDNYIPPEGTDFEIDMKNNWVGFLYKEDGSIIKSIRAKSEQELNEIFEDKKHAGMTMCKYKYVSTRKEERKFIEY